ncbi:Histone-lysine N-methyltransferase SMYD3 [Pleurostoma richardsiae]|uniref:Histone-lysine N-methyltransferase SMYD3 n=1 Tax=Pleurostoma richardsiae TaxID=41990 RepID=A0AA38RGE5_9PEZI|nr:Histone-lysine N-methyltransferase SMYD3 [Pleurostoma richardsiae]
MARLRSFHTVVTLALGLLTQQILADTEIDESIVAEEIEKTVQYTSNATETSSNTSTGWIDPHICSGPYCVFANPDIANGRGLALVTTHQDLAKIQRIEDRIGLPRHDLPDPPPFHLDDSPTRGPRLLANATIKRGTPLTAIPPVLLVHKSFLDDSPIRSKRRLLSAALDLLPPPTRDLYAFQRDPLGRRYDVKDALLAHPFEVDLGGAVRDPANPDAHARHHASYPEAAALAHDCRPGVAFHIDAALALRTVAARRIAPGEALSVAFVDPMLPGAERREWVRRWRGGGGCGCAACAGSGDSAEARRSDERLAEIKSIEERLRDPRGEVTVDVVGRLVALYKEERLQTKMAGAYWLTALGYNNLGERALAVKYGNLAIAAAAVENGPGSVEALEMSIMVKDPEGHYSWRAKMK